MRLRVHHLAGLITFSLASWANVHAQTDPCAAAARDWAAVSNAPSAASMRAFITVHADCPIYKALADDWLTTNAAAPTDVQSEPAIPAPTQASPTPIASTSETVTPTPAAVTVPAPEAPASEPEQATISAPTPTAPAPTQLETSGPDPIPVNAEPAITTLEPEPTAAPAAPVAVATPVAEPVIAATPLGPAPADQETLTALATAIAYIGPEAETAALRGDAMALFDLAATYSTDLGGHHDPTAARLMEAACDLDLAQSCAALGFMLMEGKGVPEDAAGAALRFDAACEGGVARACSRLASLYEIGIGVEKNLDQARALFERTLRFDPDNALARTQLRALLTPSATVSEPAAIVSAGPSLQEALAIAIEADWGPQIGPGLAGQVAQFIRVGDTENMLLLANFHVGNEQADKRYEWPAAIYNAACELEDGEGCWALAQAYQNGLGVPLDDPQAAVFLSKACDLEVGEACREFSRYHAFGIAGLAQDYSKSYEYLILACDYASAEACLAIGLGVQNGTFVAQPGETPRSYFERALSFDPTLEGAKAALAITP